MLTFIIAQKLAMTYAQNQGEIIPGFYFTIKDGEEYNDCFYFDYKIVDRDGNVPQELPMISGAPGIIVSKATEKIEVITWARLPELRKTSR